MGAERFGMPARVFKDDPCATSLPALPGSLGAGWSVDKPVRIDTPLGTLADAGQYFTPELARRMLHQLYLGYPDSPAARRSPAPVDPGPAAAHGATSRTSPGQTSRATGARRALVS